MDEDEDDDFEPDYVEDFELGPKRTYYPKAAPTLALPSRLAAYKYVQRITSFTQRFIKAQRVHMLPNGRAAARLSLARIGDDYFVMSLANGRSVSPPPAEVGMYGHVQLYPSAPPSIVMDFELVYSDEQKLREKHKRLYALTAYPEKFLPVMLLGEAFHCSHMQSSLGQYGFRVDGSVTFQPDVSLFGVHQRLRKAEQARKLRFCKYVTAETDIRDRRALIEATRKVFIHVTETYGTKNGNSRTD